MLLNELFEARASGGFVFTFGRFNPPTWGHKENFEAVKKHAQSLGFDYLIFISPKQDFKADPKLLAKGITVPKSPLTFEERFDYLSHTYPQYKFNPDPSLNTAYVVLDKFSTKYKKMVFLVGQDQIDDGGFDSLRDYAAQLGVELMLQSSGPRTEGVSGSDAKAFAVLGKEKEFFKLLGNSSPAAQKLMQIIKQRSESTKLPRPKKNTEPKTTTKPQKNARQTDKR
jgi:hypothetical protein